jgi:hypothetical protein
LAVPDLDDNRRATGDLDEGIAPHLNTLIAPRTGRPKIDYHDAIMLPVQDVPKRLLQCVSFCGRKFASEYGVLERITEAEHPLVRSPKPLVVGHVVADQEHVSHEMSPGLEVVASGTSFIACRN